MINANVSLRPDPRVFEDPRWPDAVAGDPELETGYQRAIRMLEPVPYPNEIPLKKLEALQAAAGDMGLPCDRTPISVAFEAGTNRASVVMEACALCGDCCSGCNVGAKKTTVMTYLPDAVNHGARIFAEVDVRHLEQGWALARLLPPGRAGPGAVRRPGPVTAAIVVLGAGSLGSTGILPRSEKRGLKLSDRLGESFTGNGDTIGFAYNNDVRIVGVGTGRSPRSDDQLPGPCITGVIDTRGTGDMAEGMVIEEGVIPSPLAPILLPLFSGSGGVLFGRDTDHGIRDWIEVRGREIETLIQGAYEGAVDHTQTLLVMAHDEGNGRLRLDEDDQVRIDWSGVAGQKIFRKIDDRLREVATATGGTHIKNPISQTILGENLLTVHPLGGCGIGTSRNDGVVDHKCRVFDGSADDTTGVHEGLYVCDGAVMPTPLGVNPLLTISALAERAMIYLARDRGWMFDDEPKAGALTRHAAPSPDEMPVGIAFSERMAGYVGPGEEYREAAQVDLANGSPIEFIFSIIVNDVDGFIADPMHEAELVGVVEAPSLSPRPLTASEGRFNPFSEDPDQVETKRMSYRAVLTAEDGACYLFRGFKTINDGPGFDLWNDTTTLFVAIHSVDRPDGEPLARGVMRIEVADFMRQVKTMRATGTRDTSHALAAVTRFGKFFAGSLFDGYGGALAPLLRFDADAPPRRRRVLRTGVGEVLPVDTEDGKRLRLTRYQGGDKGPVILSHGLGVSSLIFSIDTIETNLLEYLFEAGYDCWLFDYRASIDLPYGKEQFSADDIARLDYPPAVAKVRAVTGAPDMQMVVHCFGATTVFVPWFPQRILAHLRLPRFLGALYARALDARVKEEDPWRLRALDRAISWFYPIEGEEKTRSATSNRITALYSQLYEHDQLNQATFEHGLPEMFGVANIKAFQHLARIARKTKIVDFEGRDAYFPNMKKLDLPICFIHGEENMCFQPRSTLKTFKRLTSLLDPAQYVRHVIPNYGHIDCIFGKYAARDVYPYILEHLGRTQEGCLEPALATGTAGEPSAGGRRDVN